MNRSKIISLFLLSSILISPQVQTSFKQLSCMYGITLGFCLFGSGTYDFGKLASSREHDPSELNAASSSGTSRIGSFGTYNQGALDSLARLQSHLKEESSLSMSLLDRTIEEAQARVKRESSPQERESGSRESSSPDEIIQIKKKIAQKALFKLLIGPILIKFCYDWYPKN